MRTHLHHSYLPAEGGDRLHHVGAPILHGYPGNPAPQGTGGASRAGVAAAPLNAGFSSDLSFFIWLTIIGIVLPGLIVGGLKAGGFQFVFRGR